MDKIKDTILIVGGTLFFSLIMACLIEAVSCRTRWVYEPATIRKVVNDPAWGVSDWVTLGRFQDGEAARMRGIHGEEGEVVPMLRARGTISAFGVLGDRSRRGEEAGHE